MKKAILFLSIYFLATFVYGQPKKLKVVLHSIEGYEQNEDFARKAAIVLENVLNSEEFKSKVISGVFTRTHRMTNEELYNSIMKAHELQGPGGEDSVVDLRVRTIRIDGDEKSWKNSCEIESSSGTIGMDGSNDGIMAICPQRLVKWVKENIERYGGNPEKIFISGHSAGGHLATLVSIRNDYFEKLGIVNPIKGDVLIDAAGLDMYSYLKQEKLPADNTIIQTFTNNPEKWKAASPIYHLHKGMPPMLIYVGEKTYPSIRAGNDELVKELKSLDYNTPYHILKGKKHKPMITQFFNTANPRYKEIIEFMKKEK